VWLGNFSAAAFIFHLYGLNTVSQKKCPKCGENNPAEAVMCWACYTPLAGGATASPHAATPGSASQSYNEGSTKKAIAPWQIGAILASLLVIGVGGAFMLNRPSASTDTSTSVVTPPSTVPFVGEAPIQVYAGSSTGGGGGATAPVTPAQPTQAGQMLFTVSLPPKDGIPWGTMAIVPSGTSSAQNPVSLAAAASQQAMTGGKWDGLYVYVFSDAASAQTFRQYQSGRGGQPLRSNDYSALQRLWSRVPVRYEYSKGKEAIRYPSRNPGSWWNGSSSFRPAKI
jgi:hypothetical protein